MAGVDPVVTTLNLSDFNNDGGIDIAVANSNTSDISILLKNMVI